MCFVLSDCERTGLRPLWRSGLRPSEVRSTEACTSGMYLRHELQINTLELVYEKWRQFLDFERSVKGIFWETRKSTLLEKSISKPFTKVENLKFCRHFCLHRIHGLILIWMFLYRPMEGMFLLFFRLKGPRSAYTTNQNIYRLICNRIVDSLL